MFIWYYFSLSFWCIPFLLDSSSIFINRQRHIKNVQILSQISCNFYIFFSNCLTSFYCIILCYALLTKDFRSFCSVSEILNFVFLEREIFLATSFPKSYILHRSWNILRIWHVFIPICWYCFTLFWAS